MWLGYLDSSGTSYGTEKSVTTLAPPKKLDYITPDNIKHLSSPG